MKKPLAATHAMSATQIHPTRRCRGVPLVATSGQRPRSKAAKAATAWAGTGDGASRSGSSVTPELRVRD